MNLRFFFTAAMRSAKGEEPLLEYYRGQIDLAREGGYSAREQRQNFPGRDQCQKENERISVQIWSLLETILHFLTTKCDVSPRIVLQ